MAFDYTIVMSKAQFLKPHDKTFHQSPLILQSKNRLL